MTTPWTANWRDRVDQALAQRGVNSILEYAQKNERATFYQMADELGGPDLAPVQMEIMLREACEELNCPEYFIRSSLLRQLHHYVPAGMRQHGRWKLIRGLSSWVAMVGITPELERRCSKIADAIQTSDEFPDDWLPRSVDDPLLQDVFG